MAQTPDDELDEVTDGAPIPRRNTASTMATQPGSAPARRTGSQPPVRAGPVPAKTVAARGSVPAAPPATSGPRAMTDVQKKFEVSGFGNTEAERKRANLLGATSKPLPALNDFDEDEPRTMVALKLNGVRAPNMLTNRDLWQAVQAPVQSREGRRNVELYGTVINQFAIASNPRYEPDSNRPRAHIFVWDVSRAMNCEIPHFLGSRELTLAQTVDWVRHEGPMRGWARVSEYDALAQVEQGQLVVALPREIKVKFMAVVAPQPQPADGKPLLTGACLVREANVALPVLFGVRAADYFTHA